VSQETTVEAAIARGAAYLNGIYHPELLYDEDYARVSPKTDYLVMNPDLRIHYRTHDVALQTRYLTPPSVHARLSPELWEHTQRITEAFRDRWRETPLRWDPPEARVPIDNYAMYPLWHDEPTMVAELVRTFEPERGGWPLFWEDPTYGAHRRVGDEIFPLVVLLRESHWEQADRALEVKVESMRVFMEKIHEGGSRALNCFQGVLQVFQCLAAAERYGCGHPPEQVTAWIEEAEEFLLTLLRETAMAVITHFHSLFLLQYCGRAAPQPDVLTEERDRVLAGQEAETGAWTYMNPNDPRVKNRGSDRSNGTLWALGAISAASGLLEGGDAHWLHPSPKT
jgi:hypothetical protein